MICWVEAINNDWNKENNVFLLQLSLEPQEEMIEKNVEFLKRIAF